MINYGFSKVIEEIENEIGPKYLPGCISWTDEKFDNAWSKLLDQFDRVLASGDSSRIAVFVGMYRTQALGYIDAFKRAKAMNEAENFLAQLEMQMVPR